MKNEEWKLADAKNRFSEVVRRAIFDGPQKVRRRSDVVYVLSEEEYENLKGTRITMKKFLKSKGPSLQGVELERDKSAMRKVEL